MIAGWGKGWEYGEPGCRLPLVQEYFHEVLCLAISIQLGSLIFAIHWQRPS